MESINKINIGGQDYGVRLDLEMRINDLEDKTFPFTVSVTGGGVYKKGTTQTVTVGWTVRKGESDVTSDSTVTINDSPVSGTSKQYTGVKTDTTYNVKAVKDGKTAQGSVSAKFVNPSYHGVVSADFTANEGNIKALTEIVKNTRAYTATGLNLNNQKICYAYPKSFGDLTDIRDGNNFANLDSYQKSEVQINGEAYNVYLSKNPTTNKGIKQIYS